jgi:glutamate-1-semialdehyde aminotransferase
MEPKNFIEPKPGFLEEVQELCRKNGSLLIFDEICIGWHIGLGGAQKKLGITPDMSTFGKAMGNGFPISVVVGKAEIMRLFEEIFVSFTFAGEVSAMAASMEVIRRLETQPITQVMGEKGDKLISEIKKIASSVGLENQIVPFGIPQWSLVKFFDPEGVESLALKSLFQQEFLKRGILTLGTHNLNATFSNDDLTYTIKAYSEVLPILAEAINNNSVDKLIEGEKIQAIFKVR